jgi:hypothetical protein
MLGFFNRIKPTPIARHANPIARANKVNLDSFQYFLSKKGYAAIQTSSIPANRGLFTLKPTMKDAIYPQRISAHAKRRNAYEVFWSKNFPFFCRLATFRSASCPALWAGYSQGHDKASPEPAFRQGTGSRCIGKSHLVTTGLTGRREHLKVAYPYPERFPSRVTGRVSLDIEELGLRASCIPS